MGAYKDENKAGKWFCKFTYKTLTGERKQKKKRGFDTKRDALAYEREFLRIHNGTPDMLFSSLCKAYIEDLSSRTRPSTIKTQTNYISVHILPYFADKPINEVTALDITKWRKEIKQAKTKNGKTLEPLTVKYINGLLSTIFNFAVKYYSLANNPVRLAGNMKVPKTKRLDFWTLEEFKKFISVVDDIQYKCAFNVLYFTGMRMGELLALLPSDIDFDNNEIHITKTIHYQRGKRYTGATKTASSNRTITVPIFITKEIKSFLNAQYRDIDNDYIFLTTPAPLRNRLRKYAEIAEVKPIRLHDLRHSHASLLIELNINPLVIAERLGHDDIQVTLNTYSHLFPSKQKELSEKLEALG